MKYCTNCRTNRQSWAEVHEVCPNAFSRCWSCDEYTLISTSNSVGSILHPYDGYQPNHIITGGIHPYDGYQPNPFLISSSSQRPLLRPLQNQFRQFQEEIEELREDIEEKEEEIKMLVESKERIANDLRSWKNNFPNLTPQQVKEHLKKKIKKIFEITSIEKNSRYVRLKLDDYVIYNNGREKHIDFVNKESLEKEIATARQQFEQEKQIHNTVQKELKSTGQSLEVEKATRQQFEEKNICLDQEINQLLNDNQIKNSLQESMKDRQNTMELADQNQQEEWQKEIQQYEAKIQQIDVLVKK